MNCSDTELAALAARVGTALRERGVVVATAESCTGGWIAKALTDIAGSSAWFGTGFVSYSNAAKQALLGVTATTLARHGAVSEPVVRAMVRGCLARSDADWAIAVSGIAGPDGGTPHKPVGTVWIAAGSPGGIVAERQQFGGDREAVRRQTVARALTLLLEQIRAIG